MVKKGDSVGNIECRLTIFDLRSLRMFLSEVN